MSCDDDRLRDDAAAWVLGALDEAEAAAFARRMEQSAEVRREVEELQEAADVLPHSVVPMAPPPELRDRIMAVVEAEAEVLHAVGARADRPPRRRSRWRALLRPVPFAATACVLLLAGVAAGLLIAGGGEPARTVAAQVTGNGLPGATAELEIGEDHAELVVDGMHSAGAGHVYQVWLLHRGASAPVPAGALFEVDQAGHGTAALPGDLGDVQTVMVSVEPDGGSREPTTQPVIAADLS